MTDMLRDAAQPKYSGNVFLLIEQIFAKSVDATNDGIEARYIEEDLLDKSYQSQLDKWKSDADALPTAGKTDKPETQAANGKAVGFEVAMGATAAALLITAKALYAAGIATSWGGFGAALIVIATVLAAVAISLMITTICKPDALSSSFSDTIAAHSEYDAGIQGKQNSLVQEDQSTIQRLQNNMSKIMQQYISPANDTKTQDANMIQGAIQWMKAMIWTQSAA